jgi:organic radical activating enzyme
MKYNIRELDFETTRRCNQTCPGYCMRGESQNVDLTKDIVDAVFDNKSIGRIDSICFSGGEPTLNPGIIVYTINKIIQSDIDVCNVVMVTNGQKYCKEIVDAFNRFNEYRNIKLKQKIQREYETLGEEFCEKLIKDNTDNHARITFSTDEFHHPVLPEVKAAYYQNAKGLKITETGNKKEEDIYKTGFATIGKEFNYDIRPLRYRVEDEDTYYLVEELYVTANGKYTTQGMGRYKDMDRINIGNVKEATLTDLVNCYGVREGQFKTY